MCMGHPCALRGHLQWLPGSNRSKIGGLVVDLLSMQIVIKNKLRSRAHLKNTTCTKKIPVCTVCILRAKFKFVRVDHTHTDPGKKTECILDIGGRRNSILNKMIHFFWDTLYTWACACAVFNERAARRSRSTSRFGCFFLSCHTCSWTTQEQLQTGITMVFC